MKKIKTYLKEYYQPIKNVIGINGQQYTAYPVFKYIRKTENKLFTTEHNFDGRRVIVRSYSPTISSGEFERGRYTVLYSTIL